MEFQIYPQTQKLHEYYQKCQAHHEGDSGTDVIVPEDYEIKPFQLIMIDLQIIAILDEGKSYFLLPRSSIVKQDLIMANSLGLIDGGYRGTLKIPIRYIPSNYFNNQMFMILLLFLISIIFSSKIFCIIMMFVGLYFWKSSTIKIKAGTRLAQICAPNLQSNIKITIKEGQPSETTRGSGGFGSTGRGDIS